MLTEASLRDPILINTVGHTAGALLFGFIITLLLRDRHNHGVRDTQLSILAAALALGWNIGSLIALGVGNPDGLSIRIIMTASFALLSLLPAVLLQVTLQGQLLAVSSAGYAISAAAVLLHTLELFVPSSFPHQIALLLVAGGFALLTISIVLIRRRVDSTSTSERIEWVSLACLLLFVSSFPHFGYQHVRSPWAAEIAWHHVGIPVALVVLLRNYRFLLLDTFVRFLMNATLAVAYVALLYGLSQKLQLRDLISSSVFAAGIALVALCLSLALFAHLRNLLQKWIGLFIFHRQNLEHRLRAIANVSAKARTEDELVSAAAAQVASHFRASRFEVLSSLAGHEGIDRPGMLLMPAARQKSLSWAEVQIPLRFSSGESKFLLTGTRLGRQRYLSEDLDDMRRLGSEIVEQVERFRSEELRRLATQAELRALQSQINPHFLFNAFNTLYGTIDRGSVEARRLVLNLTDIFRYFLQGERSVIPLSEELRIIKAYLEIEALRLGDRLETQLDIGESALPVLIPMLCLQPLVENAVKHGIAAKTGRGTVVVSAHNDNGILRITVEDISLTPGTGHSVSHDGSGIGLANVRRRLTLSYGAQSTLTMSHRSHGSIATLLIPISIHSLALREPVEA
jgi:hypothetical protein